MSIINLLPDDYLLQRVQRRANMVCIALFAVVMAGVFGAAVVADRSTKRTIQSRDKTNAKYAKYAERLAQIQQLEAKKLEKIEKAKATASLLERVPRSFVLASVTQALPRHASLSEFYLKPIRKKVTRKSSGNGSKFAKAKSKKRNRKRGRSETVIQLSTQVTMTGFASTDMQVGEFIGNLRNCPIFTSVNLLYTAKEEIRSKNKGEPSNFVREFVITMELRSDIDVINIVNQPHADASQTDGSPDTATTSSGEPAETHGG